MGKYQYISPFHLILAHTKQQNIVKSARNAIKCAARARDKINFKCALTHTLYTKLSFGVRAGRKILDISLGLNGRSNIKIMSNMIKADPY